MANTLEREILERELRPRLCYVTKGDRGYGFHLHGERNRGAQLIRKIEPGSPADLSGLRSGDRVVEVNGENVEGETHQQVMREENLLDHFTWDTDRDVSHNLVSCLPRQPWFLLIPLNVPNAHESSNNAQSCLYRDLTMFWDAASVLYSTLRWQRSCIFV